MHIPPQVAEYHRNGKPPRLVVELTGHSLSNVRRFYSVLSERSAERSETAVQCAEIAAGDSRYGRDIAGTVYSKDIGDDVARVKGIGFIGPDGLMKYPGVDFEMPTLGEWRKAERRRFEGRSDAA